MNLEKLEGAVGAPFYDKVDPVRLTIAKETFDSNDFVFENQA